MAGQGQEREDRGDPGAALSHRAAPASSVRRGGGGRNFLLALGLVNHHVLLEQRCREVSEWESSGCCPKTPAGEREGWERCPQSAAAPWVFLLHT